MTVSTTQIRNVYTDPTAPTYPFTFRVLSASDLVVTAIDTDGVETVLTQGTQWRASAISNTGGTVQLLVAPPGVGGQLVIERVLPLTQPTDLQNQGQFLPETHERAFDRLALQIQQVADGVDRALESDRAGRPWYDAQGNRIINLGDAIDPQDAVNLRTMEAAIASTGALIEPREWFFTGDGVTRTFAITGAQTDAEGSYQIALDGILQESTEYEINQISDQLTFDVAPPNGARIYVRGFGFAAPMTGLDWDAEGNRIINVGDPIDATDAANRQYVDAQIATRSPIGHTHVAADIVAGQFDAARLGAGAPTAVTVLYGDGQWRVPDATAGLPFVARGDLIAFDGTTAQRLGVGADGEGLVADSSTPLGVRWGSITVDAEQVQDIVGSMVQSTATVQATYVDATGILTLDVPTGAIGSTQLADGGVISGKIAAGAVGSTELAAGAVTTAKIGDAQVTIAKLSATGTPSITSYLRGDGQWIDAPFAATVHTHAASDIVSGVFSPSRLGAGVGAIPPGDEAYYMLNAAGTFTRFEALYDGSVVPVGLGPSGGGSIDAETVRDIIGAALTDTATIDFTYNDGAETISAVVVPGSIGLTQVNTASLDTRYALVGSGGGGLPGGGSSAQFLRGDGTWSDTLIGASINLFAFDAFSGYKYAGPGGESAAWTAGGLRSNRGFEISGGLSASGQSFVTVSDGADPYVRLRSVNSGSIGTAAEIQVGRASGVNYFTVGTSTSSVASTFYGNVSITGSLAANIAGSQINSGIIAVARLGGGSPSASTYLRGDGTWATLPSASSITVQDTATIDLNLTPGSVLSAGVVNGSIGPTQLAASLELNNNLVIGGASAGISGDKIRLGASSTISIDAVSNTGPVGTLPGSALQDGSVITRKLGPGAVTSTRIADGAVGTAKVANGAITPAKLSNAGTTPSALTVYYGDGTWRVPSGGGGSGFITAVFDSARIDLNVAAGALTADINDNSILPSMLAATGVPGPTTFYRGDGVWATPAGGSGSGLITAVQDTTEVDLNVASGVLTAQLRNGSIAPSRLIANAGAPGPTTFYRGDGTWAVPAGGGGSGAGLGDVNVWTARNEWAQNNGTRFNRGWFAAPSVTEAALRVETVCQPTSDRGGVAWFNSVRNGGTTGNNFLTVYDASANITNSGFFDIGFSSLAYSRRINAAGAFFAEWLLCQGPNKTFQVSPDPQGIVHSWTTGAVCAAEWNASNAWADFGLVEDRRVAARWVGITQVVPDTVGGPYAGAVNYKYPIQFGIIFARSGPNAFTNDHTGVPFPDPNTVPNGGKQAQIYIPIYLEENCTAPGGYQIKAWGGSTDILAPYCIIRAAGRFQTGLDLSHATYIESNAPAIKMATNQRVRWGTNAEIWFDGTNLKARVGGTTVNIV